MSRRRAAAGGALALAAIVAVVLAGPGSGARANVVDRTFACKTGVGLGARTVDLDAHSGFRRGGRLEWFAQVAVRTPGQPVPRRANYEPTLAALAAGWPPPPQFSSGSVSVGTVLCKSTPARIPLSPRGLKGGRVTELLTGEQLKCYAPATVLVRIRAVFFGPTRLQPTADGTFLGATARMKLGQVGVRTPKGRALVFGEVTDKGMARLFTARDCF